MRLLARAVLLMLSTVVYAYPVKVHQQALPLALQVLRQDGKSEVVSAFEPYLARMIQGLSDTDLKPTQLRFKVVTISTRHGHDAFKHAGFAKDPLSAAIVAQFYFESAKEKWPQDKGEACYDLSVAVHLLEDSFVPYHSTVSANLVGHKVYEDYQLQILDQAPIGGGVYDFPPLAVDGKTHCDSSKAFGWVDYGAHQSFDFYPLVSSAKDKSHYRQVSILLFKEMIRTLSGFLAFAYSQMAGESVDNGLIDGYLVGIYTNSNYQHHLGLWDGVKVTEIYSCDNNYSDEDIAVSPKGNEIALLREGGGSEPQALEVVLITLPAKSSRVLCSLPAAGWGSISWMPGSQILVGARDKDNYYHVWIIDPASGKSRCLNPQAGYNSYYYAWNSDASKIISASHAFKSDPLDRCLFRIGLIDLEGQPIRALSDSTVHPQSLFEGDQMSLPDGRILYIVQKDDQQYHCDLGHCELWSVREDGSERRKLVDFIGSSFGHSRPCYGGGRLYFIGHDWISEQIRSYIYSCDLQGGDLKKLSLPAEFVSPLGFIPKPPP